MCSHNVLVHFLNPIPQLIRTHSLSVPKGKGFYCFWQCYNRLYLSIYTRFKLLIYNISAPYGGVHTYTYIYFAITLLGDAFVFRLKTLCRLFACAHTSLTIKLYIINSEYHVCGGNLVGYVHTMWQRHAIL